MPQGREKSAVTLFSALTAGRRPSARHALIAVAVMLAVLLAAFRGYGWYADYSDELDQSIALKTSQLEKLERVAAGAKDFEKEKSRLEALQGALDARLVKGSTRSLSEAMAQSLVQELAQKAGVEIRTMKVLPAAAKDGLIFLNLSINAKGSASTRTCPAQRHRPCQTRAERMPDIHPSGSGSGSSPCRHPRFPGCVCENAGMDPPEASRKPYRPQEPPPASGRTPHMACTHGTRPCAAEDPS